MQINKDLRVTDGAYYNLDLDTIAKNGIYSTDEIVVGRWINGKPIYRRVLSLTTPNVTGETKSIGSFNAPIGKLIKINFMVDLTNYIAWVPVPQMMSADSFGNIVTAYLEYNGNTNKIMVTITNSAYKSRPIDVIVEYTKSTD